MNKTENNLILAHASNERGNKKGNDKKYCYRGRRDLASFLPQIKLLVSLQMLSYVVTWCVYEMMKSCERQRACVLFLLTSNMPEVSQMTIVIMPK